MVFYGTGDTATIMSEGAKNNLKTVFDAMCSYSTSSGTETITKDDGAVVYLDKWHPIIYNCSMLSSHVFFRDDFQPEWHTVCRIQLTTLLRR